MDWTTLPTQEVITSTIEALKQNGFNAEFSESGDEAKKRVFELIPLGAEVMNMTSVTLDTLGIAQEINESGKFDAVRPKLMHMDPKTQHGEMNKLGAAPEYTIGSVHAVTEDGHVVIASRSGSQLPSYTYGSPHVVWVVGAQKIVKNVEEGIKRIYEYVLGRESERVQKAYGLPHSDVDKLLIYNAEVNKERIHLILVNEQLGF